MTVSRFPYLGGFKDLEPYLDGVGGVRLFDRGDHLLVNYVFADEETFRNAHHLECRGLVFDKASGAVLARPFHKFFNLGEREPLEALPLDQAHRLETKLDGSMVFGLRLGGKHRFFTRGGASEQAAQAWGRALPDERAFVAYAVDQGLTPIHEWTAPDNRIVVFYPESRLTLLAVRERDTGRYLDRGEMEALAEPFGVRVVEDLGEAGRNAEGWSEAVARVRALEEGEGVVAVFPDGHRIKIKAEAYVTRHRAVSHLEQEKHVARAWIEGQLDDVAPLLPEALQERVRAWGTGMGEAIAAKGREAEAIAARLAPLSPRERAAAIQSELEESMQPLAFSALKGRNPVDTLRGILSKSMGSMSRYGPMAEAYGLPRWRLGIDLSE